MRRPFVFPILKRNKNSGFSHVESGNRDTPRFVLKNRDILIKSGRVAGLFYFTINCPPAESKSTLHYTDLLREESRLMLWLLTFTLISHLCKRTSCTLIFTFTNSCITMSHQQVYKNFVCIYVIIPNLQIAFTKKSGLN